MKCLPYILLFLCMYYKTCFGLFHPLVIPPLSSWWDSCYWIGIKCEIGIVLEDRWQGKKIQRDTKKMKLSKIRNGMEQFMWETTAGSMCAVENNKWGNKHGWENQGRSAEAIKSMKCYNRVAVDTVPYSEPTLKQKAFFPKSLWCDCHIQEEHLTYALLRNAFCVCL